MNGIRSGLMTACADATSCKKDESKARADGSSARAWHAVSWSHVDERANDNAQKRAHPSQQAVHAEKDRKVLLQARHRIPELKRAQHATLTTLRHAFSTEGFGIGGQFFGVGFGEIG